MYMRGGGVLDDLFGELISEGTLIDGFPFPMDDDFSTCDPH